MEHILNAQLDKFDDFLHARNYEIINLNLDPEDPDILSKDDYLKSNFYVAVRLNSVEAADFVDQYLTSKDFSVDRNGYGDPTCFRIPYKAILQLNWNQQPPEKLVINIPTPKISVKAPEPKYKVINTENEWTRFLDEFRVTDTYRKSNGINLFPLFFEWMSENYNVPEKKKH